MEHIPVLLNEVLENIANPQWPLKTVLDGTFGRGGHSRKILEAHSEVQVTGLDRDDQAIEYGQQNFSQEIQSQRLRLVRGSLAEFQSLFAGQKFSAILLDLGVSSPQLDKGDRGFSFYHQGPLDMRMDRRQDLTAAQIVNTWEAQDLSDLFYQLGEIRFPNKVVRKIIEVRKDSPIETTDDLSTLIAKTMGWSKKGQHPATKYFMALRLRVNEELEQLEEVLPHLIEALEEHGRLLVISFHSLEDRIVKNIFKASAKEGQGHLVNKKVIQAQWPEKKSNPRARSAKLRVFEKGDSHEPQEH